MNRVTEINHIEQLDRYRSVWNALLEQTPLATFFQSLDWLKVYWRHFGQSQRLRVLVVESGGRPLGIVPLVVRTEQYRLGAARVLSYPLDDWGTFYSPLGPQPAATLVSAMKHVARTRRDWDLVDLRWVDRSRTDRGRTQRALETAGLRAHEQIWDEATIVDMAPSWRDYWSTRDSHWRTNIRRSEKKLAAAGDVRYVRYRPAGSAHGDDDPRWDLYEACLRIAQQSWQGTVTNGTTISHEQVRAYLRDTHVAAAKAGALDVNLLWLDGRPAAFAYNYHYQRQVFGLRMGYDAGVSRDGTGSVLVHRMLRDSHHRGDRLFDMGPGSKDCKRHWRTRLVPSCRYMHFPTTAVVAQSLRLQHHVKSWLGYNPRRQATKKCGAA
jgi:CelD/BcsL family acetyltransferase involved in cellulose biosynthesis